MSEFVRVSEEDEERKWSENAPMSRLTIVFSDVFDEGIEEAHEKMLYILDANR
jgi:hypothetical protein